MSFKSKNISQHLSSKQSIVILFNVCRTLFECTIVSDVPLAMLCECKLSFALNGADPTEGNSQLCQGTTQQSKQPMSSETSSSLMSLDLQLQQLSVFASQRRLSTAAALLTVVQQVQDGLRSMTKPRTSTAAEIAVSPKVTLHSAEVIVFA